MEHNTRMESNKSLLQSEGMYAAKTHNTAHPCLPGSSYFLFNLN